MESMGRANQSSLLKEWLKHKAANNLDSQLQTEKKGMKFHEKMLMFLRREEQNILTAASYGALAREAYVKKHTTTPPQMKLPWTQNPPTPNELARLHPDDWESEDAHESSFLIGDYADSDRSPEDEHEERRENSPCDFEAAEPDLEGLTQNEWDPLA